MMRHVHLGVWIMAAMLVIGLIMAFIGPNLIGPRP
jgi:hypothetical protein